MTDKEKISNILFDILKLGKAIFKGMEVGRITADIIKIANSDKFKKMG
jgi:hypothetical protein